MKMPDELVSYFDKLHEERLQVGIRRLEDDFSSTGDKFGSDGGTFSLMTDCFLDDDPTLFEHAIPWLKEALNEGTLMRSILRVERSRLAIELEELLGESIHHRRSIDSKERELRGLCAETLRKQALHIFDGYCSTLPAAKDFNARQCKENFVLTRLLNTVYEIHRSDQREQRRYMRTPQKTTAIYQYYKAVEVDLLETDAQYRKYNLHSVTEATELLVGIPNRILDSQHHAQFLIEHTPSYVLTLFKRLRDEGLIKDLALLTSDDVVIKTNKQIFVSLGIERVPQPVKVDNLRRQPVGEVVRTVLRTRGLTADSTAVIPSVSKFYNPGSEDNTWCSITDNSMTFEEIAHIPDLLEDCAVTRMIHLEYFVDDGRFFVSHIDHEFIFYTLDEFDRRANDPYQKGNARKRLKTFKIDQSAVPFMLDDGTLFVHTLIDACFEKSYLLMDFLLDLLHQRNCPGSVTA
ncbi:hypothetical protein [Pseudomonas sichuanensis]|uniref:hypothetical protein n=1 Tax=Pseudomonas sichuanensis TaxID=2213015 RepID=UPI002AB88635|nr:hypothetical protein [Pseudomonas sichuanensis]MDZ4019102.1 hypothetical protein [Pseudomonas sichuanensis]